MIRHKNDFHEVIDAEDRKPKDASGMGVTIRIAGASMDTKIDAALKALGINPETLEENE